MDTFRIIMYIIITIVIVLLVYTKMHNDIKTQIIKINSAESKIDESLIRCQPSAAPERG